MMRRIRKTGLCNIAHVAPLALMVSRCGRFHRVKDIYFAEKKLLATQMAGRPKAKNSRLLAIR
jgi:hypothetical protein